MHKTTNTPINSSIHSSFLTYIYTSKNKHSHAGIYTHVQMQKLHVQMHTMWKSWAVNGNFTTVFNRYFSKNIHMPWKFHGTTVSVNLCSGIFRSVQYSCVFDIARTRESFFSLLLFTNTEAVDNLRKVWLTKWQMNGFNQRMDNTEFILSVPNQVSPTGFIVQVNMITGNPPKFFGLSNN